MSLMCCKTILHMLNVEVILLVVQSVTQLKILIKLHIKRHIKNTSALARGARVALWGAATHTPALGRRR